MKKRAHRSGFTLVELLVVIAIIAVLISILLPSLSRARASANNIKCLSNLSQLAQVLFIYTAEHQQKLPYNGLWLQELGTTNSYFKQLADSPLAGMLSEGVIPQSSAYLPVYRGFSPTPEPGAPGKAIATPLFLICPAAEVEGENHTYGGGAPYYVGFSQAHFAGSATMYNVITLGGGDEGPAIYSKIGQPAANNQIFSNYAFNALQSRGQDVQGSGGPAIGAVKITINGTNQWFQNVFKNYSDDATDPGAPGNINGLLTAGQNSVSMVTNPAQTWMAMDSMGGVNYLDAEGSVFRHPNTSCNYVYFDGHAENLRTTDISGGTLTFNSLPIAVPMDMRMLPVKPN